MRVSVSIGVALLFASIIILSSIIVAAQSSVPIGPTALNVTTSTRATNNSAPVPIQVEAGNVTNLDVFSERQTRAWAGFYGNISGRIKLDDGNNYTFYDWSDPNPQGEIYAANSSNVNWQSLHCLNVSQTGDLPHSRPDGGVVGLNNTLLEEAYGIEESHTDGLNETFVNAYADAVGFDVGSIHINASDECSMTNPYVDQTTSSVWEEILLTDNNSIVFTAILEDNSNGYQPGTDDTYDFQLMVLENGQVGFETTTTTYYFYVELS